MTNRSAFGDCCRSRSRIPRSLLYLLLICILLPVSFLGSVDAQRDIEVDVRCAGAQVEGLPPDFGGTIYRVLTPYPYAGNGRWELEAITAQGSVLTDIPVPDELNLTISPVEISPDGRYVVFQPVAEGTALAVWDRVSNEMSSLVIPAETANYLNAATASFRQQRKIDWLNPDQFVIRFFDLENNVFFSLLAEQVFTVTPSPLMIVAGDRQTIDYPSLPFPREEYKNTITFSPQRTYVQASFEDELVRWIDFRYQIYDTETLALVADFNSTESFRLSPPQWSYDESVLFLVYSPEIGRLPQITEINVAAGFQESIDLRDTLLQTFGSDYRITGIVSLAPSSSTRLLIALTASDLVPYAVVNDYEARTLKAVCRGASLAEASITGSLSYPVWGPDENLISFYDSGNLRLFDLATGQSYYKSVFPFVGWIDM
jgi:hypothetical protein